MTRIILLACFLAGLNVRDAASNPVNCANLGQGLGPIHNCLPIGPQEKREKPELPEKPEKPERPERPERPEFPESELYEPEEPDVEEPDYRGLGWGTPKPCPPGNKNCNRGGNGGSHGVMGVYKAAAFIGVAILIAIMVTILSLVIYCVWKRRRDRHPTHNSMKITNANNGYATPGGKCPMGGSGAICTCMNTTNQCCERAKGSRQLDNNAHHYAGPSHNPPQPTTQVTRAPHVIPYAQSEAYPIRSDKPNNDDNIRGYMGLIKSRPEGDPKHPTPPNHPRPGITQAVNHEYHMPQHGSGIKGTQRINHPQETQRTHALSGGRSPKSPAPDADPYYFKLDDSQDTVQPRSMMPDRNVPDLIANRPLPSKDLMQERCSPAVDERVIQKGLVTQRGGYDAIFVQDGAGSNPTSHGLDPTEESYDKLDRSRKSFRPRDNNGDYNTISLDVLKI